MTTDIQTAMLASELKETIEHSPSRSDLLRSLYMALEKSQGLAQRMLSFISGNKLVLTSTGYSGAVDSWLIT